MTIKPKLNMAQKPQRYELTIKDGTIYSIVVRHDGGITVTDATKMVSGKSLVGSRKHLAKMAKMWGVQFVDKTAN